MTASTSNSLKPTATPASTRAELAQRSARGYTVVRNSFVQVRVGNKWVGSKLGRLVEARQPRALRAYLLMLMVHSTLENRSIPLEAGVWARALSPAPPAAAWSPAAMTRVWSALEGHNLISRERKARLVQVVPRREDGRQPYTRPRPDQLSSVGERYFIIPDCFWIDGWHEQLSMPGIAVLLILIHDTSARDEVRLPYDRIQDWYGISAKTLQNGLADLRRHGLLHERHEWVVENLSAIGRTQRQYYSPTGPFSPAERKKLQVVALMATRKRVARQLPPARRVLARNPTGAG